VLKDILLITKDLLLAHEIRVLNPATEVEVAWYIILHAIIDIIHTRTRASNAGHQASALTKDYGQRKPMAGPTKGIAHKKQRGSRRNRYVFWYSLQRYKKIVHGHVRNKGFSIIWLMFPPKVYSLFISYLYLAGRWVEAIITRLLDGIILFTF